MPAYDPPGGDSLMLVGTATTVLAGVQLPERGPAPPPAAAGAAAAAGRIPGVV